MRPYRVYYEGGASADFEDDIIPVGDGARRVQCILQFHPDVGWYLQSGATCYVYRVDHDRWWGADLVGLYDYLLRGWGLVLIGSMCTNEEFSGILAQAKADKKLCEKTGSLSRRMEPRK